MNGRIENKIKVPITQSKKWQKLQDSLGEQSFFKCTASYQYLAIMKHTPVGNYLFLPYGPTAIDPKGFSEALDDLRSLASSHHFIFIRLEPQNPTFVSLLPTTAKKVKDVEPAETWVLDLPHLSSDDPLDDPAVKSLLPSRLVRYYKGRESKGINVAKSHNPADIRYLVELQSALARKKGITTFSADYLKTELKQDFATLYLVRQHDDCLAAGLVFDDLATRTRYNLQGAQSDRGRPLHATGILTIELILDAIKTGQTTFDFWGIAPDGAPHTHPWYGFTAFKKTFAGREVRYAGTYDLPLDKAKYSLYNFLKHFKR